MTVSDALWTVSDEAEGREYRVFPWLEVDGDDELDGRAVLADVAVLEVLYFDEAGRVIGRDVSPASRRFDDRVWQLLRKDRALRDLIEAASPVLSVPERPAVAPPARSNDESQAAVLESLRDLIRRRREGRGLRDVS